jgi:aspartate-semialdehyde dehydrogenase
VRRVILGNATQVVPYISGEEEKMQLEYKKILGGASAAGPDHFSFVQFPMSAHTNRYSRALAAVHR